VFGRRKKDGSPIEDEHDSDAVDGQEQEGPPRPQGPWDVDDAAEDTVSRIDLGALRIPVPPETEVRVDVSPEGQVVAATLVQGSNVMQVNAFAAPRSYGIWDEVREEIATTLRESGGAAEETEGPWGTELLATVPTQDPAAPAPARFVGVDGPRWFLRALLTGPAATDREQAAGLESALRDVVVSRGSEAMAVRSPLPLSLPREVTEAQAAAAAAEPPAPQESGSQTTDGS
jgi:hypothetical protein